jgi:hypothetical protein
VSQSLFCHARIPKILPRRVYITKTRLRIELGLQLTTLRTIKRFVHPRMFHLSDKHQNQVFLPPNLAEESTAAHIGVARISHILEWFFVISFLNVIQTPFPPRNGTGGNFHYLTALSPGSSLLLVKGVEDQQSG